MSAEALTKSERMEVAVRCPNCGKEANCHCDGVFEKIEAVVSCKSCAYRKKQPVSWPKDAFYRVEVCNDVLWGWSREHLVSIRDFVSSKTRNRANYCGFGWGDHRRIPAHFLDVHRREAIVRAIDGLLNET